MMVLGGPTGALRTGTVTATRGFASMLRALRLPRMVLT